MDIEEIKKHAREYVELEAPGKVIDVEFVQTFKLFGREDIVMLVKTTSKKIPEWWVVGGSSPLNLYDTRKFSADEAYSFHIGLMLRMSADYKPDSPESIGFDAFICHASEDKESFVRPLAMGLSEEGLNIWFDEFELNVGDSLRQSIDRGLTISNYGIVVLSEAFFEKRWPQYELDGLVAREIDGENLILPIWYNISSETVLFHSPSLAGRVALIYPEQNIAQIVQRLKQKLEG